MTESSPIQSPSTWAVWAQLVRLPNVFTVLADVAAAFLLVASGPEPITRFVAVLFAGVCLYWSGMILNDVFDVEQDRRERSQRPLAAGHLSTRQASLVGWGLLAGGVALAFLVGWMPAERSNAPWLPGVIGIGLAVMIVAYDGPLKPTLLAPAAMGACRVLSFLLGASAALTAAPGFDGSIPRNLLAIAFGFGIYIMGVTTVGRREAVGDRRINFFTGLVVTLVGLLLLAFAPQIADPRPAWQFPVDRGFPLLIFLIGGPVLLRQARLLQRAEPLHIQQSVKLGVLTLIPLAAAFALLGAGPFWGILVFALVFPCLWLSGRFRVT